MQFQRYGIAALTSCSFSSAWNCSRNSIPPRHGVRVGHDSRPSPPSPSLEVNSTGVWLHLGCRLLEHPQNQGSYSVLSWHFAYIYNGTGNDPLVDFPGYKVLLASEINKRIIACLVTYVPNSCFKILLHTLCSQPFSPQLPKMYLQWDPCHCRTAQLNNNPSFSYSRLSLRFYPHSCRILVPTWPRVLAFRPLPDEGFRGPPPPFPPPESSEEVVPPETPEVQWWVEQKLGLARSWFRL